jgi:Immunoglobulin I-set domain
VPPTIDSTNLEMRPKVIRGKSITLNCPVQGLPFPNITWLKDGNVLEENERIRYLLSGRQLEISLAEESDASSYTCHAVNVAGKARKDFTLDVLGELIYTFFTSFYRFKIMLSLANKATKAHNIAELQNLTPNECEVKFAQLIQL